MRPYLKKKNLHKKKGWWSGSKCRPRVQIPTPKKKKKTIPRTGDVTQWLSACLACTGLDSPILGKKKSCNTSSMQPWLNLIFLGLNFFICKIQVIKSCPNHFPALQAGSDARVPGKVFWKPCCSRVPYITDGALTVAFHFYSCESRVRVSLFTAISPVTSGMPGTQ
jgi:hypothetical protein